MSSYIEGVYDAIAAVSSEESALDGIFDSLKFAGEWAEAVAKLIGLVA